MSNKTKKNVSSSKNNSLLIYGKHPVEAAVRNKHRLISQVFACSENAEFVKKLLSDNHRTSTQLNIVQRKEIDKLLPPDAVHQGVVAFSQPLDWGAFEDFYEILAQKESAKVLVLDQVTDPQNIGAIIRSCAAFNADALIVQDKNSPQETAAMIKASAGTIELVPVLRVVNLTRALEQLQKIDFWVLGMDGKAQMTLDKIKKPSKVALVMGSEGSGMRRLVQEACDEIVKLPINPLVESLNVSTAAAIALYEFSRE